MLWTVIVVALVLSAEVKAKNESFIYTHAISKQCKTHFCRDGYKYDTYYNVDSGYLKQIRKDSEVAFEMHIGIQATRDGHIILSPVLKPGHNDSVYEIVVGGGENQFTELRRNVGRNGRASVKTPDILSTFEMRGFVVRITQEGLVEFGKEGETLPLLSYIDIDPIEIKYFSFAAWNGVEAKFLYDCPSMTASDTGAKPNSKEIDPPLSPSEQLRRSMLEHRSPWNSPKPVMNVSLGVKVTSVKYDAFQSKLATAVSVVMSWTDETMAWYPDKFNGTTSLKLRQGEIWRPQFYVFNSDSMNVFDDGTSEYISMAFSGEATFHFQTKIYTWCTDSPTTLSAWPHDEYSCSIVIQPWEVHEKISLEIMDSADSKMKIFSDIDTVIENEWDSSTTQTIIEPAVWNRVFFHDDSGTHLSDRFIIYVELKREATPYNIVFYTPLLVLMTFVLLSFWSEPLKLNRVWFYAGCTIVIVMGLCFVDYLIPIHTMPSILVLYTIVLASVIIALLIQVLLMTSSMQKLYDSKPVQCLLTSFVFRKIFCLPNIQPNFNGRYNGLTENEDPPLTSRSVEVEEMESENAATCCDKAELAEVIDRILFLVYFVAFISMLAAHF